MAFDTESIEIDKYYRGSYDGPICIIFILFYFFANDYFNVKPQCKNRTLVLVTGIQTDK